MTYLPSFFAHMILQFGVCKVPKGKWVPFFKSLSWRIYVRNFASYMPVTLICDHHVIDATTQQGAKLKLKQIVIHLLQGMWFNITHQLAGQFDRMGPTRIKIQEVIFI
ncbi:uncharacterized protein LOC110871919 [Helianthus annuus]|uniref:uncharacterized protein LOC110871919 n=1 Tax=Helianthus annuus TaxID=4232 RepID=UPI001653210A|nr:uncharacterized protein LOC110871919 [Helianthus annuus]